MISYKPFEHTLINKGLKKSQVADLSGIHYQTIMRMARNKPVSLDIIDKICTALNCPISSIVEILHDDIE